MYFLWQKCCHHHWRRKPVFWTTGCRSIAHSVFRPSYLTSSTAPGRKRVWVRAMSTKTCLLPDISTDQLDGWTVFWDNRAHDYSWTRRGGLCVYNIDARCLYTAKANGQCFPRVKLLIWRRWPHHLCVYKKTVYVLCNMCSVKEFTNYYFIVLYNDE